MKTLTTAVFKVGEFGIESKTIEAWNAYWGGPILLALASATAAGVLVSLITPPNTVTDEQALALLAEERQAMEMQEEQQLPPEALEEDQSP